MDKDKLRELIKNLVKEYSGHHTMKNGSPRPFSDDVEELENYMYKSIYGGDGGHYTADAEPTNYNRQKMGMFELREYIKKLVKEQAYGSATLTHQGPPRTGAIAPTDEYPFSVRPKRTATGMMEYKGLKEFTSMGQEGIYPRREEPGDMFQQKEVEELLPNGMASRDDRAFQDRLKQHADWTEESGYNNTFVHIQYHDSFDREHSYRIHQSQNYNGNYDDFRNPKFTVLTITKTQGGKEEELGKYIVDTDAYLKDFEKLRNDGVLGKQVSESLKEATCRQKSQELADSYSAEELQSRLDQIMRDMEQEAEPEGGPIADMYADEMDAYEGALKIAKGSSVKKDVPYDVAIGRMTQDEYDTIISKDQFNKSSKFDRLKEQTDPAAKAYEIGLKRLQKGVIQFQLKYIEKQKGAAMAQAATAGSAASKGFDEQIDALRDQIKAIDNPEQEQNESLFEGYVKSRKNISLMTHMDIYKQTTLLEGTMKKLFSRFSNGETNEEVLSHYAKKGISMPETFLSKARKQYENLKKQKLDIDFAEQEAKDIITIPTKVPNIATFDLEDDNKKLAKGIYQEKTNN